MWYKNGNPNSGTSSHFVRITPKTVPVYSIATTRYSNMHSTVCSILSKPNAFMIKNTTPNSTGIAVSEKRRLPMYSTITINSTLQSTGSAICV